MQKEVVAILALSTLTGCKNTVYKNDRIPSSIVAFGKTHPEAKEFVDNFLKYKDVNFDMNVSTEMKARNIPLFIQWDKRWGYKRYGKNYLGIAGCGPSCMAMVACGLKQDPSINPYTVSKYSTKHCFYKYGKGTLWELMTTGAKHYGLGVVRGNISKQYILTNLSEKTPMICSMSPGIFTKSGHFIVLTGVDNDGKITINDPNSPIKSARHWKPSVLIAQMKAIWAYRSNNTTDK